MAKSLKLQSKPLPMHLLVKCVMPYLAYRKKLLPIMWRLSKTARKVIELYEPFWKTVKWSPVTWIDLVRKGIEMTATFESDLAYKIDESLERLNTTFSGKDFCKSLYGSLAHTIHCENSEFFIFFAKLVHYDEEPRKFMTQRLDYAEIRVG